jgi:hypothetical protein
MPQGIAKRGPDAAGAIRAQYLQSLDWVLQNLQCRPIGALQILR